MNKNLNVVFAVVFLFGFIYLWDTLVMSRYSAPRRAEKSAATETSTDSATVAADAVIREAERPTSRERVASVDSIVVLESEGDKVVMKSAGAAVASWQLHEKDHVLEMLLPEKSRTVDPLETFGNVSFSATQRSDREVEFVGQHPSGFEIRKTLSLDAQPPFHTLSVELRNTTGQPLAVQTLVGWGNGLDKHPVNAPYEKDRVTAENRAVAFDGRRKSWSPGLIFGRSIDRAESGTYQWVGVGNNHFLAAIVAPEGTNFSKIHVTVNRNAAPVAGAMIDVTLKPGEVVRREYLVFVGPKQPELLESAGHGLSKAIDYGTFGVISKGLLAALKFFKGVTGNYGWAIVLLTLCIQIVMFPLTKKSLEHSVKMKELQPHLKRLQEQHKEDPKRYQIEMMNFYKRNGMRFMGLEGCLPLLLQMPIFLAFYSTLNGAYDLRGAAWILWIQDLAQKDPYYVLPVIMGGGMFLQQKMSGSTMDPAQARMMMIMPIVFTFMFLSMPAGLVLYWVVNSLVTICVQKFLSWRAHRNPTPVVS